MPQIALSVEQNRLQCIQNNTFATCCAKTKTCPWCQVCTICINAPWNLTKRESRAESQIVKGAERNQCHVVPRKKATFLFCICFFIIVNYHIHIENSVVPLYNTTYIQIPVMLYST